MATVDLFFRARIRAGRRAATSDANPLRDERVARDAAPGPIRLQSLTARRCTKLAS